VDGTARGSSGAQVSALVRSGRIVIGMDTPGSIAYRLNGGPWTYAPAAGRVTVTPTPGMTWSTNLLDVVLTDQWGAFGGLGIDADGSVLPLPPSTGPRVLALGDSITEGNGVGPQGTAHTTTALLAWPAALRDLMGAQVGVSASGSRGWLTNAPLVSTWSEVSGGAMDFTNPPDVVVIMAGGGEPDAPGLAQAVRDTLNEMLRTLPQAQILVLGHTNSTSPAVPTINAAVRSVTDPRVHFVDAAPWIVPAQDTTDGVHHAGWVARAVMAPHIAQEIRRALG
jgi:hypothetical protein